MANPRKGKLLFIYFVFVFAFPDVSRVFVFSSSSLEQNQSENEVPFEIRQYALLKNLEELVRNLSDVVSKLELRLSDLPPAVHGQKLNTDASRRVVPEVRSLGGGKGKEDGLNDGGLDNKIADGSRTRAVSVTKYSPFWSERFHFLSAVKLESDATCIRVLPLKDFEGHSKYVAVGDERGRIYVLMRNGDVAVELRTMSEFPITAMLSYISIYRNETLLVTGHKNGAILMHRIWEGSNGEELNSIYMEHVMEFVATDTDSREGGSPISILEVHHVGRTRYILSSDIRGEIKVFREDGTVHGSVMPMSRPIAFLKQRLLFLTESGAGSLDLRSMKLRESECEGLNYSLARNYVFDATERSKAYGFTSDGDLINVLLLGDIMNFKCRVRSKRKFEIDEPLDLQAIKGYLLVISNEQVHVFNVSSQHYVRVGAPRLLFSAGLDEIRLSFLNYYQNFDLETEGNFIPLISSDREKLLVFGLRGGYVGMYRSNLPIFKGEFNTMLWTSPVLFFILFLFGAWHFFAKKKEALTSWGPDDPFTATSPTTGAPLGTGSSERASFIDTPSRSTDMMDLRGGDLRGGGGLRGPPRRYGSPTGYPGGATNSFRPATTSDHSSRPAAVDPNYRAASELKFRGSPLEPPGFPKRREPLFANNQVVNQGVDESS